MQAAKSLLSRLVEAACRGEEVIVSRAGGLLVKLVPVLQSKGKRILGQARGQVHLKPGFLSAMSNHVNWQPRWALVAGIAADLRSSIC